MFSRFIKSVLFLDAFLIALEAIVAILYSDSVLFWSAFYAQALATVNAISGFYFINKFYSADFNDFMKSVFGGMGVRLLLLAAVIFVSLKFVPMSKKGFIISLFISYICKSVLEMIFITKKGKQHRA